MENNRKTKRQTTLRIVPSDKAKKEMLEKLSRRATKMKKKPISELIIVQKKLIGLVDLQS